MISELFWQCSISYMISKLFWQCGIFLHDFWTVLTVWYISTWFLNCSDSVIFPTWFLNCSDSVLFPTSFLNYSESVVYFYMISELLWQCCIFLHVFLHDFGTVLTVWYFSTRFRNCSDSVVYPTWFLNCSDSIIFPTWFLNCSDSVVFFDIISELFR